MFPLITLSDQIFDAATSFFDQLIVVHFVLKYIQFTGEGLQTKHLIKESIFVGHSKYHLVI